MYGHVPSTSVATRMSISGLIELAYNNSYKASIKMEPFELLIGVYIDHLLDILNSRKQNFLAQILYKNPWRKLDIIKSLRTAESCERSYLSFWTRGTERSSSWLATMCFLKISPMKKVMRFGKNGNLI